jgi:hypothetical protein
MSLRLSSDRTARRKKFVNHRIRDLVDYIMFMMSACTMAKQGSVLVCLLISTSFGSIARLSCFLLASAQSF